MSGSHTRRRFLRDSTAVTTGLLAAHAVSDAAFANQPPPPPREAIAPDAHAGHAHAAPAHDGYLPVEVPDVPKLPYTLDGRVKVFHLTCEPVKRSFVPGWTFDLWGYNGSVPGPTIEAVEGDRVRIHVTNNLPELTSMHWHGLELPIGMDGVPGVCQDPIMPSESYTYEFDLIQNGTFFYHSHMPMQELIGMIGFFIIHPRAPHEPRVDKDFGIVLQEWGVLPNNTVPNTLSMEFNWLTFNGKAGPDTTPLIVKRGERVRIRLINMGMDHHPIHIHGNTWYVTGAEAGRIQPSAWMPGNTVLVGVAQARDVEFDAKYSGDWMLHCHLPHHMMNHMMSMVGPMAHTRGVPAGRSMTSGMGMLDQGSALSDDVGPSMGRGMGFGSDQERVTSNHVGGAHAAHASGASDAPHQTHSQQDSGARRAAGMQHKATPHDAMQHGGMQHGGRSAAAGFDPWSVPGYPQDMFMPDDAKYEKPENYGLRKGWSGAVEGMTTLVRVLEPELYDKIRELQKQAAPRAPSHPAHAHDG